MLVILYFHQVLVLTHRVLLSEIRLRKLLLALGISFLARLTVLYRELGMQFQQRRKLLLALVMLLQREPAHSGTRQMPQAYLYLAQFSVLLFISVEWFR